MVVVLMGMSWFMVFEVNETYGYPLAMNRMLNYRNKVLSLDNKNPKKKHVIKEITPADVINVTSYLKKTNVYSEFYKNRRKVIFTKELKLSWILAQTFLLCPLG
ncbi:unnamed protein product [Symbiodinium sp. CCMP2592]|nr:unnamed protein product [Symbiodinium sp. CCMP2592]